ncbi:MAG: UDP-3-O-(3-hydroxymyristoyl)glucosamine N-acyltransferase [Myxococcota bacterium]|nr:UDP-3-O-(3-hydroxymyristoyl)glucosamine N-acyltransferase [Myxococcota bacterium]
MRDPRAFLRPHSSRELASWISGEHHGVDQEIHGVGTPQTAGPTEVAFVETLVETSAGCLVCPEPVPGRTCLVVEDPKAGFIRILERLISERKTEIGHHPTAVIEGELGPGCSVGPHAVIGAGASLGANVVVHAGVVVGSECRVGDDTELFPGVVLYPGVVVGKRCRIHSGAVLGADGFSFHPTSQGPLKVPQIGGVIVEDDVEIGANTCIDRAFLEDTRIGAGSKLDNLVQVGHNTQLGQNCLLAAQTGLSGSVVAGDGVMLGGQVGVRDHVSIGSGASVGAGSAVAWSLAGDAEYFGRPAQPLGLGRRAFLLSSRLPEIWKALLRLEQRIEQRET